MNPPDPKSDDERWVDELAGRTDAHSPASTRVEASSLRGALRAREARALSGTAGEPPPPADLGREAQLLARARAEGLLGQPRTPRWVPWLAAAAITGLAVGLGLQMRSAMPPDALPIIERAGPQSIHRIVADDPVALKQQLLAEFRAAGVKAQGYESLGVQGIDADLPQPLTDAVLRVLQAHGIPQPADGVLLIEIAGRE